MSFTTADLYDDHAEKVKSCSTPFRQFGGRRLFSGRIRTIQCCDDNLLIKRTFETASPGEVLVVDGGGSLRSTLLGDIMAEKARRSGWSGVVIYGAVRDSLLLPKIDFGVKAIGTNPQKSLKLGSGKVDVPVSFGGVTFTPGEWIYSDEDGILVATQPLTQPEPDAARD